MKKLITILLILCVTNVMAGNNTLQVISENLDVSEDHAFKTLVTQQRVIAVRNLITMVLGIFAGLYLVRMLKEGAKEENQVMSTGYNSRQSWAPRYIVLSIIVGGYFVAALVYNSVNLGITFTGLLNPEYGALEQLKFLSQ